MNYFIKIIFLFFIAFTVFGFVFLFNMQLARAATIGEYCDIDNYCTEGDCVYIDEEVSELGGTCRFRSDDSDDSGGSGGSDEPSGLGGSGGSSICSTDADCAGDAICREGNCMSARPGDVGNTGAGGSCTRDGDCLSGLRCTDGRCTAPDPVTGQSCGALAESDDPWAVARLAEAREADRGIFTEGLSDVCMAFGCCGTCDIMVVISNIFQFALSIVGILAVIVLVVAGILYITSGGNQEQVGKAKAALTAAVVGTVITLAAWLIVNAILNAAGFNDAGTWFNPSC